MKLKRIRAIVFVFCLAIITASAQTNNKRYFQLSFISPLGTNGLQSHLTTNVVSFNILGGHSYGNTAFEFGSLYNVNTHFTKGFQLAGVTNYSGDALNTGQFAGVANVVPKGRVSFQFSGIVNLADKIAGLQFAGISNISKDMSGVQFAGILNVAKHVKGVQFGLINYAEKSDGVSIGLINIVKKGGKREVEVAFSETLNTSVSFKLGTDKFYTIFSGGIHYLCHSVEYAAGLGFGTHIDWKKGWGSQVEVVGYDLTEKGAFDTKDLNMLTQLKFTVSKDIARHFKVFAGPVLNMTISKYENPETGMLGSSLSPWSMWKNSSETTRLNAWIGCSAGMRF